MTTDPPVLGLREWLDDVSRRAWQRRLFVAPLLFITLALSATSALAQSTGLIFARPDRLAKVPLAYPLYSGASLPPSVDLAPLMPSPGDQGRQNSCVAWTLAYALKTYQERIEEQLPLLTSAGLPDLRRHFSPAFLYNQIVIGPDKGANYLDALQSLATAGAATLAEMPYDATNYTAKPSAAVRKHALRYRIDGWKRLRVDDLSTLKSYLDAQFPIAIGTEIDEGFAHLGADFVWRAPFGASKGGHAMLVVGFDDARHAFRVLNSWGRNWADHGFAWIDYDYFPRVVREAFVVRDAVDPPEDVNPIITGIYGPLDRHSIIGDIEVPATAVSEAALGVTKVRVLPSASDNDSLIQFDGSVSVPPGTSGRAQIIVRIFYTLANAAGRGAPLRGHEIQFSMSDSTAAAPSESFIIAPQGSLQLPWTAQIPISALDFSQENPIGSSKLTLLAVPILYVNQFGVKEGLGKTFVIRRKVI